jgi:hypothetical protein
VPLSSAGRKETGVVSVDEVKAGMVRFGDETTRQVAQMRAVADSMERSVTLLRGVAAGANHTRMVEALARMEQARQRLQEAMMLAQGAVESTRSYVVGF